jgi:hypothetical protein
MYEGMMWLSIRVIANAWNSTVKKLVGELDFSFHVVSTQAGSGTSSSETLVKSASKGSKKD